MNYGMRIVIGSAALTAGLAMAGASNAQAQVAFQGSFPLPHGSLSISVGDPAFAVGSVLPARFPIALRAGYGHGFGYRGRWIPVRRLGRVWVVCDRPELAPRYDRDRRFDREDRRYDRRRHDRGHRAERDDHGD